MATFVGIDPGTTNSVVATRNAYGRPEVFPNREGQDDPSRPPTEEFPR